MYLASVGWSNWYSSTLRETKILEWQRMQNLGKVPHTTTHIPQDTCTSMVILRMKLMLKLCATFTFLLVFQTNKTITLKVCQAAQFSVSSAFPFVLSLFFLQFCTVKQACKILGTTGIGAKSWKTNRKNNPSSPFMLCSPVYTAMVKNSQRELGSSCFGVLLYFMFPQVSLIEEPMLYVPALCRPGPHTSPAQLQTFPLPTSCFLFLLKHICTSLFHWTRVARKNDPLNIKFCTGKNTIHLQQTLPVWNKILLL